MTFRDLLIEAIQRAESLHLHGYDEALCLIDQPEGRDRPDRSSYTLAECHSLLRDLDSHILI